MKKNHPFALSPLRPFALFCLLLSAFCFLPSSLLAQKNKPKEPAHKLTFNIKDCNEDEVLLAIHFRGKLMKKDSALNNGKNVFIFQGDEKYDGGLYSIVAGNRRVLDFMMDDTQNFTFNLDTTGNVQNFSVTGSPENAEMLRFQLKTVDAMKKKTEWLEKRKEFAENNTDSADYYFEKIKKLDSEMEQFITELIDKNPTFLFSKLQKSNRDIEIPDPPVYEDGSIDSSFKVVYYRTHYWDNFDLTDKRFIYLPSYEPKLNYYVKKMLWYQEVDTINKYVDLMLDKTHPDSLMYRFLLEYLSREFENNNMIGHDGVFVHIVKNNQLAGKCKWMDEDLIKRYKMRIDDLEPLLIGKKSIEMIIPDTTQSDIFSQWISSYQMPKKYRILWFFDHTCSHCLKESKEMKVVYDSLAKIGKLNFDVYAVNQTDDIEGWKKYIQKHGFTWINVGGNKGNIDWKKEYHIASNPQFYIINQDKIIILNRGIAKSMIPTFLEGYEKAEAERERLKNNK